MLYSKTAIHGALTAWACGRFSGEQTALPLAGNWKCGPFRSHIDSRPRHFRQVAIASSTCSGDLKVHAEVTAVPFGRSFFRLSNPKRTVLAVSSSCWIRSADRGGDAISVTSRQFRGPFIPCSCLAKV